MSEDDHDIRQLETTLVTRKNNSQTFRHSLCRPIMYRATCHQRDPHLSAHRSTTHANRLPKSPIHRIGPPGPLSRVHSSMSTGKLLRLLGQK
jgi:hypothetical protein